MGKQKLKIRGLGKSNALTTVRQLTARKEYYHVHFVRMLASQIVVMNTHRHTCWTDDFLSMHGQLYVKSQ